MRRQFRSPPPRPSGFYLQYLEELIAKRNAEGTPPAGIADEAYWAKRREYEAMKIERPKKAA